MNDRIEIEIAGQKLSFVAVKLPIKITVSESKVYFIHRSDHGGLQMTTKKDKKLLTLTR